MSDITRSPAADKSLRSRGSAAPVGASGRPGETALAPDDALFGVPGFRMTGSLAALQELVALAETVPAAMAHDAGLSTSELHSLGHLMDGPMGPVELAKHLGVTSAASSGVVDRLCRRGHAERRPHPGDGRRTEVVITDSGRAELMSRLKPMFEALADLDNALDDDERALVERYLRGAMTAMRRLVP